MSFVLGIDAGGTRTRALLAEGRGDVLGRGIGGPGNVHSAGWPLARESVLAAIRGAFDSSHVLPDRVDALCIGAAGAGRREQADEWERWCQEQGLARRVQVVTDAELVIAAALWEQHGIVVIAGTGSIAFARGADGQCTRAGGWGYVVGDEGSAYDIACQGLRAVFKAFDGRLPGTALTLALPAACGCVRPPELVAWIYGSGVDRHKLAQLAVVVNQVAEGGDAAAQTILCRAGEALAELAVAAGRAAGLSGPIRCGLSGGVLLHSRRVRDRLIEQMATQGLDAEPLILVDEPAQGAVRLARSLLDERIDFRCLPDIGSL